jgi:hypothetical protein
VLCVSQQCDASDYYDSDKFMGTMMERDLRQMLFRRRFTRVLPENIVEVRTPSTFFIHRGPKALH